MPPVCFYRRRTGQQSRSSRIDQLVQLGLGHGAAHRHALDTEDALLEAALFTDVEHALACENLRNDPRHSTQLAQTSRSDRRPSAHCTNYYAALTLTLRLAVTLAL
jgi:hypothetical protein